MHLHLIFDSYATHKHPKVQRWLKRHPRFHVHFIQTSSLSLNLIERRFSELIEKTLRRGNVRNVSTLVAAIRDYIDHDSDTDKGVR